MRVLVCVAQCQRYQNRHTDFVHVAAEHENWNTTEKKFVPQTHSTDEHKWLIEFCLHDRVLAMNPLHTPCDKVYFVHIPARSVVFWREDVVHCGTGHAAWRLVKEVRERFATEPIFSFAIHWYCDAMPEDTADGKFFNGLFNVPRDVIGQQCCLSDDADPRNQTRMKEQRLKNRGRKNIQVLKQRQSIITLAGDAKYSSDESSDEDST